MKPVLITPQETEVKAYQRMEWTTNSALIIGFFYLTTCADKNKNMKKNITQTV